MKDTIYTHTYYMQGIPSCNTNNNKKYIKKIKQQVEQVGHFGACEPG